MRGRSVRAPLSFKVKRIENVFDNLRGMCEQYVLLKVANNENPGNLVKLQTYYNLSHNIPALNQTNITYYKVGVINDLYVQFIASGKNDHIILEGDQATYERLQSIRAEYGNECSWLILFPGDWHFLKNYQQVLIKVYFDGGLSELSKASGYTYPDQSEQISNEPIFFS